MKYLRLLPALLLCSCADILTGTSMYYPSGKKAFHTSGNNTKIEVDMGDATWHGKFKADVNNHSQSIDSRGVAITNGINAAGNATGQAARAFVKP